MPKKSKNGKFSYITTIKLSFKANDITKITTIPTNFTPSLIAPFLKPINPPNKIITTIMASTILKFI